MASKRLNTAWTNFWRCFVGTILQQDTRRTGRRNRSTRLWNTSRFSDLGITKRPFVLSLRPRESGITLRWWRHGSQASARKGASDDHAEAKLGDLLEGTASHQTRVVLS